jgi:hypothetical protein
MVKVVHSRPEKGESTVTPVSGHGDVTPVPAAVWRMVREKRVYAAVLLTVIVILLGAFFLYRSGSPLKPGIASVPEPSTAPASSTKESENTGSVARSAPASPFKTKGNENTSVTARSEVPAASASVNFRILPWGEIYIDGVKKGVCPPLTTVKLKPGKYKVEIKNTSFPTYSQAVEVKSNGSVEIKHKFQ